MLRLRRRRRSPSSCLELPRAAGARAGAEKDADPAQRAGLQPLPQARQCQRPQIAPRPMSVTLTCSPRGAGGAERRPTPQQPHQRGPAPLRHRRGHRAPGCLPIRRDAAGGARRVFRSSGPPACRRFGPRRRALTPPPSTRTASQMEGLAAAVRGAPADLGGLEALLDAAALAKARAAPRGAWRPRCLSAEVAGLAAFCAVPEDGAGGGGGLLPGRQRRDAHRSARGAVREVG